MSLRWAEHGLAAGRFGLLEQLDLAGRLEAGYGAEVGRRPCLGQAQRLGPQALVTEEALDALAVADQGAGLSLGALLTLPSLAAGAAGSKVAIPLAKLETLKSVGGSITTKVKDKLLLLVRDSATSVRAFNPVCTHRQCVVAFNAGDKKIKCPCHGSQFDLDGRVVHGPASRPPETYPAELVNEQVIVTL
jgi:nitrite reductase/ring-hydroxylating ferredoxin subunit